MDNDRGLLYFGQTRNYNKRSKEHFNDLKACRHVNIKLQRLFNCKADLMMFPVEECTNNETLNEREIFWIKYHNTTDRTFGLNLAQGGHPLKALSEEAKQRKADGRRGKPGTLKGKKQSSEWIEARVNKTRGQKRKYSEAHIQAIRNERKKRIGLRQKGKIVTLKNLKTEKITIFNSKREVEDFLGIERDKLIHKFYQGKPRRILKEITLGEYLITR